MVDLPQADADRNHLVDRCADRTVDLILDFGIAQIESLWNYRSPLRNPLYAECRDIGCHAGISNVVVNWDGSVYPCGLYPDNQLASIGNALEEPFASIWEKSVMLREIRALTLETIGQPCTECELRNLCGGGCRGAASLMTGAYAGLDLRCPIVKDWYVRNNGTPTMGELR